MSRRHFTAWIVPLVICAVPAGSAAQTPAATSTRSGPSRIYLDVHFLGHANPLGEAKTFENYALTTSEVATFKTTYPEPSGPALFPTYAGGGFMLTHSVGVGLSFSRMSTNGIVGLFAEVPHPTFLNRPAIDTGNSGAQVSRNESAMHLSLAVAPIRTSRVELRMMAGPSFFTLKGHMVKAVQYRQTFSEQPVQNAITITGISTDHVSGNALGFHAGADFTYFMSRFVGVTGGVRFDSATVTIEAEPLSKVSQDFRVGGTTTYLGLRFRLGPAQRNN